MSASGQTRRSDLLTITSGLPPTTDVHGPKGQVSKVPKADSARHATYPPSIVRLEPVMKPALTLAR